MRRRARIAVAPLKDAPFALYAGARFVTLLGSAMSPIAYAFAVLQNLHGGPGAVGAVVAMRAVPVALLALVGGAWVDRRNRRAAMVACDVLAAGSQLLCGASLLLGHGALWQLLAAAAALGIVEAVYAPAAAGFLPELVASGSRQPANALVGGLGHLADVLGPALAGILVVAANPGWAIVGDGATFAVSAALLAGVSRARRATRRYDEAAPAAAALRGAGSEESTFEALVQGWRLFRRTEWLVLATVENAIVSLFVLGPILVLGPVISERSLGGAASWAAIMTCFSAGAGLGAVLALVSRARRPLVAVYVCFALLGPLAAAIALGAPVPGIAAVAFVAGAADAVGYVLWETVFQELAPSYAYSRLAAYDAVGSVALSPLGAAVAGLAATTIAPSTVLWASATIALAAPLAALLTPVVRRVELPDPAV